MTKDDTAVFHAFANRRRSPEWFCKPKVAGSIPSPGTKSLILHGSVLRIEFVER